MSSRVLVLNQDYQAIGVCSPERAFVLVFLEKAETVCEHDGKRLKSIAKSYSYPSVIRLFAYVHIPYKRVALTRQNILRRDGFSCLYCGSRQNLTMDHVLPRSRGGKDSWTNLATACQKCNSFKGDRTPAEASMKLRHAPFRPSFIMYIRNFGGNVDAKWKPYLFMN